MRVLLSYLRLWIKLEKHSVISDIKAERKLSIRLYIILRFTFSTLTSEKLPFRNIHVLIIRRKQILWLIKRPPSLPFEYAVLIRVGDVAHIRTCCIHILLSSVVGRVVCPETVIWSFVRWTTVNVQYIRESRKRCRLNNSTCFDLSLKTARIVYMSRRNEQFYFYPLHTRNY